MSPGPGTPSRTDQMQVGSRSGATIQFPAPVPEHLLPAIAPATRKPGPPGDRCSAPAVDARLGVAQPLEGSSCPKCHAVQANVGGLDDIWWEWCVAKLR